MSLCHEKAFWANNSGNFLFSLGGFLPHPITPPSPLRALLLESKRRGRSPTNFERPELTYWMSI